MINLPHLAQRIFNVPLAIHPLKAEVVMAALTDRFGITRISSAPNWSDDDTDSFSKKARDTGYEIVAGIAVIPIQGTLVQKLGFIETV
jgi:hypothetical protein